MNTKLDLRGLLRRLDVVVYWLIASVLSGILLFELPRALAAKQATSSAAIGGSTKSGLEQTLSGVGIGAAYSIALWILIPLIAFIFVNVRASRIFWKRIDAARGNNRVPVVRAKPRVIAAGKR